MATSSINIQPIKHGSEMHNNRLKDLEYVRKDLTHLNEHFNFQSVQSAKKEIEQLYVEKVGQKMQAKSEPIREAVLIIEPHHTIDDLADLADQIQNRFGIKAIQGYIHKDEGHYDELEQWKPNLHAHLIFDWQDKATGKSIKLNRQDMSELQTLVSERLNMERGISSDKKHLNALAFKIGAEKEKLSKIHNLENGLEDADNLIKRAEHIKANIQNIVALNDKVTATYQANLKEYEQFKISSEKEKAKLIDNYNNLVDEYEELSEKVNQKRGQRIRR